MKAFRRVLVLSGVAAATLRLGFGLATSSSGEVAGISGNKSAFKPNKLAGTWKGSWNNNTFNTSGSAKAITYSFKGKMNNKKANAQTKIFENGVQFADSTLLVKKK